MTLREQLTLWAVVLGMLGGLTAAGGTILSRLDAAKREASQARQTANAVRRDLVELRDRVQEKLGELAGADALCRQRTESLRGVLEILIPSGIWPDRVVLPDPPPGWAPWPVGNKYGHEPN